MKTFKCRMKNSLCTRFFLGGVAEQLVKDRDVDLACSSQEQTSSIVDGTASAKSTKSCDVLQTELVC